MVKLWQQHIINFIFISLDELISSILYTHGYVTNQFQSDIKEFDISSSFIDLWALCFFRFCLIFGTSIGISMNRIDGPKRLKSAEKCLSLVCLMMPSYAIIKMLLYSETEIFPDDPWFWGLFVWTFISSLVTYQRVCQLSGVKTSDLELGHFEDLESLMNTACNQDTGNTKQSSNMLNSAWKLTIYSKRNANLLVGGIVLILISTTGEVIVPFLLGKVLDSLSQDSTLVNVYIIIMALLSLLGAIAMGLYQGLFNLAFARLNVQIRSDLFTSIMERDISFFDSHQTGELTSLLTSDTTVVSDIISQNAVVFLRYMIKAFETVVLMTIISWRLSMILIIELPILLMFSRYLGSYYKKLAQHIQQALAKANNTAEENISGIKTVRSFGNEEMETNFYTEQLNDMYNLNKKQALLASCYSWYSKILQVTVQFGTILYGSHLVQNDIMTSGNLITVFLYQVMLTDNFQNITSTFAGLIQGIAIAQNIFQNIKSKSTWQKTGSFIPETLNGEFTFRNVTFAYPNRPLNQVLKNISFTLCPCEITVLVGTSGSGKTSCMQLLKNFYTPQIGTILLDNRPLEEYDNNYLHAKIAMVGQEPMLFARSIQENIAYGLQGCSMDAIVKACKFANAHGFITELSDSYNTDSGEKGTQLSGGQKQRIAIARALVRKPQILLLDEATSALDGESEDKIYQELKKLKKHCTIIIASHCLSIAKIAQKIIVMDKGTVVEQGNHKELMKKEGVYFRMVKKKMSGAQSN
ncbi:ABC-type oligopeptide transporter ABCB9-like isoform X1 [Pristis pectinata]|uniref:ABC-type oligopeptide transporter ABCB9-like isoform X1 n=1 Tax=Pristis pectinata TaxID=685728 RepID=UPI00223CD61A|nr:ABC-type oligopeptide transporter ABCB9-like isoform X1 [Pristis pectinata]XP_051887862.1 ABC-type oligopeptide transporter ABCB9-like isoform X1 [Pristis pectinata]